MVGQDSYGIVFPSKHSFVRKDNAIDKDDEVLHREAVIRCSQR